MMNLKPRKMVMETEMEMGTEVRSRRGTKVVILLCVTGLARVSLVMATYWVQLGGKYAGKPCAKQPGQTTKPKCGSSKMKRNLSKDEEEAAFRRKNRKDPNPDRRGKFINVKTEETIAEKAGTKDACYHKVKSRYKVWISAYASGALVKCRKKGAANWGNSTKKESVSIEDASEEPMSNLST